MNHMISNSGSNHSKNSISNTDNHKITMMRRVCGVNVLASKKLAFHLLNTPELEVFITICHGSVDNSNTEYVKCLPSIYNSVSKMSAQETILVGS